MYSQQTNNSDAPRHGAHRISSFPNAFDGSDAEKRTLPQRAHTFHDTSTHGPDTGGVGNETLDAFESGIHGDAEEHVEAARTSVELDDLPIELITLTDSFIESLSAKVHTTPPNIEKLSRLFQDFYALASTHINTHVSALATRQRRDTSPAPSMSPLSSAASRIRSKAASLAAKDRPRADTERQMITAEELTNRKKARRALESKRATLEEAVERRLCEGIYEKIYRHRSTHDEAQDEKLRSKTAALALVGITPADLGVQYGDEASNDTEASAKVTATMRESLSRARADLTKMSEVRYPLAKVNHLKAAHKSIVDTLADIHPSASADEIMPMLIYTLITLPPENFHVISDLHFIHFFRNEQKLTGEAAYCLTNLEAAMSFLDTVDLSTLRADEHPSGPGKPDTQPDTQKTETFPPVYGLTTPPKTTSELSSETAAPIPKPERTPSGLAPTQILKNRRLSDLVNTPAQAFGAASGAVFSTADQGLQTISSSLSDSYSFLLGKLRERQEGPKESIAVPRTLEDARKLVSTPPLDEDDNNSVSSSVAEDAERSKRLSAREDRVLNLIGGRRDVSADSTRSGTSPTKYASTSDDLPKTSGSPGSSAPAAPAMLDSVRNLGSSFNPIGRLSGIGMIRGFGRQTPAAAASRDAVPAADGGDLATAFPDIAAALPPKQVTVPRIPPPNKRFIELQSPGDLKIGEIRELLKDYRRLAVALKNLGAFDDT